MNLDSYIKAALATVLWNEPHDDSLQGLAARGLVVRNRVKAGWDGSDWLAVIEKHESYNFADKRILTLVDFNSPLAQRFLWQVTDIYSGAFSDDMTEGALWYASEPTPGFVAAICSQPEAHPIVARVGRTKFYK